MCHFNPIKSLFSIGMMDILHVLFLLDIINVYYNVAEFNGFNATPLETFPFNQGIVSNKFFHHEGR